MNKSTSFHAQKTGSANQFLNAAIVASVALTVLPAAIFGAVRILHSQDNTLAKTVEVEEKTPKRSSAAERRAQRLEARKAKEAQEQNTYPEITMEKVDPYYDGFEMEYDADMGFNNGPGMIPPAYMGGPGMMPPAYMGNFNGGGRMQGPGMDFNNGFGRGRGRF